jgi:uncharacterized membrane protein
MATMEDKECFIRVWNESFHMNNLGFVTPLYAAIIVGVLFLLCSCATKKEVIKDEKEKTEVKVDSAKTEIAKQDSTHVTHKTDVKETEKVETKSKVEKSDSTVMTVDSKGNVIKQETWHKEKETVSRNREYEKQLLDSIAHFRLARDSLRQYIAKYDSLTEKINHQEVKVVEKTKIPKIFKISLIFSILCCIFAFVKLIRWLKIH